MHVLVTQQQQKIQSNNQTHPKCTKIMFTFASTSYKTHGSHWKQAQVKVCIFSILLCSLSSLPRPLSLSHTHTHTHTHTYTHTHMHLCQKLHTKKCIFSTCFKKTDKAYKISTLIPYAFLKANQKEFCSFVHS